MAKNRTKILVVGLGSIGQRHARLLSERRDAEIYLCDPEGGLREQAAAGLQCKAAGLYGSIEEALKIFPEIVFICVPNHLHISLALQSIECGADVFIEKPVSDSLVQAKELEVLANKKNSFVHVGYMLRYDEGLLILREIVEQGGIGNLVAGRAMIGSYITLLNAKGTERIDHENTLVVDYTHEIDFITWFFGDVVDVMAMKSRIGNLELLPHPNIFQINLRFSSSALVQIHMDYVQFPQRRIFEIYGDRGTIQYDFMTGEIRYFSFQNAHEWVNRDVLPITDRWDDLFRKEHESVLTRRAAGLPPGVSLSYGIRALEIADRIINVAR